MGIKGPDNRMRKRIFIASVLSCVFCFALVIWRLFYMQVVQYDYWASKASEFQTQDNIITPLRGTIYDTNMNELAVSAGSELIYVDPSKIVNDKNTQNGYTKEQQQARAAELLSTILEMDYDTVLKNVQMTDKQWRKIKANVDKDTANALRTAISDARRKNEDGSEPAGYYIYSGIGYQTDVTRYYPNGSLAAQLIGFTNSSGTGSNGIEEKYDSVLAGTPGRIVRAVTPDNDDMPYEYEEYIAAEDGASIVLTIDSTVQSILEKHCETALADNPQARGGVQGIVMEIETGEIKGMCNMPEYNLNATNTIEQPRLRNQLRTNIADACEKAGLNRTLADELSEDYLMYGGSAWLSSAQLENETLVDILTEQRKAMMEKQWRNNIVKDTYEPGSVFKLFTVAAAYEEGIVNEHDTFYCGGSMQVDDTTVIGCHKKGGHGMQTLTESLMNSCNVALMNIALRMGHDTFKDYMEAFGLFDVTGIDLNGEEDGYFYPTEEQWHLNTALATASFGQRFNATPLQIMNMVAAIVNNGELKTPHVVREVLNADGTVQSTAQTKTTRQVISEGTSAYMRSAMEQVVAGGTGKNAYVAGYRVGGKTSTSEILKKAGDLEDRYSASFAGVAPIDDPQYVVLVIVSDLPESAPHGGGAVAAPVVGRVFADILPYLGVETSYEDEELDRMDVTTPMVSGRTTDEAAAAALAAGFSYRFLGEGDIVSDQVPAAGAKVPYGSEMIIYLGGRTKTDEQREVPNLIGVTPDSADYRLELLNLYLKRTGVSSSEYNYQTVGVKQSPAPGTMVDVGTVITVEFQNTTGVSDR